MSEKKIRKLSPDERLRIVRERTPKVRDHILEVLELNAANEIVAYSDTLSKQIPKSYGAHAFVQFQNAMFRYEVVRIAALWDGIDIEKLNIPTLAALLDEEAVIKIVLAETREAFLRPAHILNVPEDPKDRAFIEEHARLSQQRFTEEQVDKAGKAIRSAIQEIYAVARGSLYMSVANMRDKHLAHALVTSYRERTTVVAPMKFGQERDLLNKTTELYDRLMTWVDGHFDWEGSRQIAKANAEALWCGCTVKVLR